MIDGSIWIVWKERKEKEFALCEREKESKYKRNEGKIHTQKK